MTSIKQQTLPLVTIIVPSYNHEKYIEETIDSIVNQTYENIELIVIDDGSKDESPKLLQELSQKHHFTLVTRENKGLCRTLNEAISLAEGEYISICASDDKYLLDKIEKQVVFLERNKNYVMSYGKKINFYPNGLNKPINNPKYRSGKIFKDLLLQNLHIPPASTLYRKELFNDIGGFDTSLAVEDVDMFLRIASRYEIGFQDDYYYYYRVHDSNTINNTEKMESDTRKILEKWQDHELYTSAIRNMNLLYFRNYAPTNKKKALLILPKDLSVLFERAFYQGMLRLFIPTSLYYKLKGLN